MFLLHVRSDDPEEVRRGRILAVILLGFIILTFLLTIFNVATGGKTQ